MNIMYLVRMGVATLHSVGHVENKKLVTQHTVIIWEDLLLLFIIWEGWCQNNSVHKELMILFVFSHSVFQNHVEIHVNHIQSGLSQMGNLSAFAASSIMGSV